MGIDVELLLDKVAGEVGLDDFGDPTFRIGLDRLVDSMSASAAPSDIGWASAESLIVQGLTNRLRVTDWIARHPSVADERIESPLFIVGLPRTGTTALSQLLAADPGNRSLLMWEVHESVPPPTAATYRQDPRFVAAMEAPNMLDLLNPGFKAIHHDPPDMPIECAALVAQHFTSLMYSTMFNVPEYDDWLVSSDLEPAYRWHRSVLQLLQSECPGQWQLKSPVHCYGLDGLTAVYPDARFVVTHRDPTRVVASVCSLIRSLSGTFTEQDHTAYIAHHWPELIATMLDMELDFRARVGDAAFIDIAYDEVVADPVGAIGKIYEHWGRELSPGAAAGIRAHHAGAGRKDRFGKHTYALEEFGLRREAVAERFADYTARFDIRAEP